MATQIPLCHANAGIIHTKIWFPIEYGDRKRAE